MTILSEFCDEIKTRLETLLPNHQVMTNVSSISRNTEGVLKLGQGFHLGSAQNTNIEIGRQLSIARQITVIISQQHMATEFNRDQKFSVEKELLEYEQLIIDDFETNVALLASNQVAKFVYVGDSGIENVFEDRDDFVMIRPTFSFEYFRAI